MPHARRFRSVVLAGLVLVLPGLVTFGLIAAEPRMIPVVPSTTQPGAENPRDEMEVLIIQALDQPTDLNVQNVPIRTALQKLADSTGIPIQLERGAVNFLPEGSQTKLTATIQGHPLRESLRAVLLPLGLQAEPTRDRVLIKPTPPLRRMVRRATWPELETLKKLYSQPWSEELFKQLTFQFVDSRADDAAANRQTLGRLAQSVGAGSAAVVLEYACDQYGWTWYPDGDLIAVLTKTRQVERQLETLVSVRYDQANLQSALLDLARQAGVPLRMDPGVIASLPPQTAQQFSLAIENAPVRQVFEVVAGQTGLGYFVEGDGIRLTSNILPANGSGGMTSLPVDAVAQSTVRALRANSIVGQVTIPNVGGASFSFFIREDDLPPDVNEMRKAKIQEAVSQMKAALTADRHNN